MEEKEEEDNVSNGIKELRGDSAGTQRDECLNGDVHVSARTWRGERDRMQEGVWTRRGERDRTRTDVWRQRGESVNGGVSVETMRGESSWNIKAKNIEGGDHDYCNKKLSDGRRSDKKDRRRKRPSKPGRGGTPQRNAVMIRASRGEKEEPK